VARAALAAALAREVDAAARGELAAALAVAVGEP
jgi:hypothetical protein